MRVIDDVRRGDTFRIGPMIYKVVLKIGNRILYKPLYVQLHYNAEAKSWEEDPKTGSHIHKS